MIEKGGRRTRSRMVALACALSVSALTGCSTLVGEERAWPGSFREINAVVSDLDLSSTGDVVFEGRFGTNFPVKTTYYVALVETDDGLAAIRERLSESEFTTTSTRHAHSQEWIRYRTSEYIDVRISVVGPGEDITVNSSNDQSETVEKRGYQIRIRG